METSEPENQNTPCEIISVNAKRYGEHGQWKWKENIRGIVQTGIGYVLGGVGIKEEMSSTFLWRVCNDTSKCQNPGII